MVASGTSVVVDDLDLDLDIETFMAGVPQDDGMPQAGTWTFTSCTLTFSTCRTCGASCGGGCY